MEARLAAMVLVATGQIGENMSKICNTVTECINCPYCKEMGKANSKWSNRRCKFLNKPIATKLEILNDCPLPNFSGNIPDDLEGR